MGELVVIGAGLRWDCGEHLLVLVLECNEIYCSHLLILLTLGAQKNVITP